MDRSTTATTTSTVTYAGIDYHKKFSWVCLGDADGNIVAEKKLYHDDTAAVKEYFKPYRGIVCTVESCRAYEWFVDLLKDCGLEVRICNPRLAKLIVQSRCKTDKLDGKKLMELLAKGYLPTCYQASPEEKRLREWLRWRASIVRSASRVKIQIHSLLDKERKGLGPDTFASKMRPVLQEIELSPARRQLLDKQLELLSYFETKVKAEDAWVKAEAKQNGSVQLLKTIPGIGDLSALLYIAEVGNPHRFRKAGQVSSFLGLVPSESSSAEKRHLGAITKQGSPLLRWLLVQDAWQAIRTSAEFRRRFTSIRRRQGKHVAIVAIARILAEVAFHVLVEQQPYEEAKLQQR